ncbi:MAG: glutamine-hydrolyzing GMP synthase [candidate division NC10 bacterium]|nr:glutamine-hydrolyzing GMP synthase [candidate division NC10 bacterium]
MHSEKILILDFGSQYTQLIARCVREAKVYCEILPFYTPVKRVAALSPKGLILSGGPSSIYDPGAPSCDRALLELPLPILGICYGMQLMAHLLGGKVVAPPRREYGRAQLFIDEPGELFHGLPSQIQVWMSHQDQIASLPPGFYRMAHTENTEWAAFRGNGRLYGVQFHPEVVHTPHGREILKNFLYRICACSGSWDMKAFVESSVAEIRSRVGKEKVVTALSGGVDSSVAALLVYLAVRDQLICIFVDNGFLRKGEAEAVRSAFESHFHLRVHFLEAKDRFLSAIRGVIDPEQKRVLIGNEFIRVFEEEAKRLGGAAFLVQGTLYPDVIESTSVRGPSSTIKTHHNVGGLPEQMEFSLIEPLRELFKDEVRQVGRELGLPHEILARHPFPGPGLAVRILGEVTEERLQILREADSIVEEEIRRAGLYDQLWQAFAILLLVRSVGVMGDGRTYEHVAAIRAVISRDGMTADWARLPHEALARMSTRIINEVKGINRVVYDISSKPPSTIEWE